MADLAQPFAGVFTAATIVDLILQRYSVGSVPTPEQIYAEVDTILAVDMFAALRGQREAIKDELLRRLTTIVGRAHALEDNTSHVEWLAGADRGGWRLWPRLKEYLVQRDKLPPAVIEELDNSTDQTLGHLESPTREDSWSRRGLVVGHVQSGKTTHYTALAAKAIDAGYQLVIVLAGVHNSLRSQTHERFDKHLVGRDSAALLEAARRGESATHATLLGVGQFASEKGDPELPFTILTCTTSAEDGDFRKGVATQIGFPVGPGTRLVMVVKKNATILRQLCQWLRAQNAGPGAEDRIAAPTLVIDDEADHASINTKDPEQEPATINRLIRQLLMSFDRAGFVGYTATPFANIFIPPDSTDDPAYGPDLFPRSFIVNLQAPSDYIGPDVIFGHPGDESLGLPERLPLPMYVEVGDASEWLPDRHNKSHVPGGLPESLAEALRLFVLVCAARAARGQESVHNSMLIHATRFVNVQNRVHSQVQAALNRDRAIIESGAQVNVDAMSAQYQAAWQRRIVDEHNTFRQRLGDGCLPLPTWETVWGNVLAALVRVKAIQVNGESTDALAYSRTPNGRWVVAIGGDKLSRGLTLEGLSVSYFLRTSNMFDTLMQMGRWFGYRPGYSDLCRVYTTPLLYRAFREIALAMEDLRADLDRMADANMTPLNFGLRVRTPSDRLLITAANKIRSGEPVYVRFAGEIVQALEMPRTGSLADRNRASVLRLLSGLGEARKDVRGKSTSHNLWSTTASAVLEMLEDYEAYSTPSFIGRCDALRRYINERVAVGELVDWTVVLVSQKTDIDSHPVSVGGLKVPRVMRKERDHTPPDRFATQAVVGSAEEALDLSGSEYVEGIELTKAAAKNGSDAPKVPTREMVREARPATRGLLLIYLIRTTSLEEEGYVPSVAISFPTSDTAQALKYTVGETWRQLNGLVEDADE